MQGHRHPQQLWGIRPDEIRIMKKEDGSDWVLGSGGYGSVYKASMNDVDTVAVKVGHILWSLQSSVAGRAGQTIDAPLRVVEQAVQAGCHTASSGLPHAHAVPACTHGQSAVPERSTAHLWGSACLWTQHPFS